MSVLPSAVEIPSEDQKSSEKMRRSENYEVILWGRQAGRTEPDKALRAINALLKNLRCQNKSPFRLKHTSVLILMFANLAAVSKNTFRASC